MDFKPNSQVFMRALRPDQVQGCLGGVAGVSVNAVGQSERSVVFYQLYSKRKALEGKSPAPSVFRRARHNTNQGKFRDWCHTQ